MHQFKCGATECDFLVRSNDEDEIVQIVTRHAEGKHDRHVDEEYVRSRIEKRWNDGNERR